MKKLIYCAAALATALFAGSCQRELLDPAAEGNTVTYTVNMPEVATKAGESNLLVDRLVYAVYRVKDSDTSQEAALANLSSTCDFVYQYEQPVTETRNIVSLELINNQKYVVAFWAQKDDKWFTHTNDYNNTKGATEYEFAVEGVGLTKYAPNVLEYDAFSGVDFIDVNGSASKSIELTRPFAQLNIATNLPKTFTAEVAKTTVRVTGLAHSYNVVTKEGTIETNEDGTNKSYEFVATEPLMAADDTYAGFGGYDRYISANYVFVAGNQTTATVSYAIETAAHGTVTNTIDYVPLARNYKTNIVGNLLTSKVDYDVEIKNDWGTPNNEVPVVDADNIQAILDNAVAGTTIQLKKGVNYGTLYLRPIEGGAQTKVVDWIGNNYRFETYSLFENITIVGAEGATVDAIEIEGGTYYNTEHSQAETYPVMLSLVELKNVVFDGVTFTGKGGYDPQGYGNAVNLSGGNIKVEGLTFKNCVLNNSENNARLLYKTESTTHVHDYSYNGQNYTFSPSLKDITITGCTFNGGYMGLELRETENVTITNNVFNVADRNILLPVNTDCTYSGKITITGNVSNNAKERFVRADGTGDAVVVIKDNILNNYQGADADYIKVTNANNVTIENNVLGVSTAEELQFIVDMATGKTIIKLCDDINGDVMIYQKADVYIVIDGDGKKYDGQIKVHTGSTRNNGTLLIKNIEFDTEKILYDKNNKPYFYYITTEDFGVENGVTRRYSQNITVQDCEFTASHNEKIAAGIYAYQCQDIQVIECNATEKMHSLIQAQSCDKSVTVMNCTITNSKNGVAFKQVKDATVEGTTILAQEYGIRFDGNTDNYGITVTDNTITATQPFIVRKMTGKNNTIALEGTNTLNTTADYQIVITNGSDDAEYVKPTGTYTLTGADSYRVYEGKPVATVGNTEYDTMSKAIAAWTNNSTLTLMADVTLSDVVTLKSTEHHILDLSTYTLTAAEGKNAFVIKACGTGASERTAITITADSDNPGGINAGNKSIVYYNYANGEATGDDRPIIKIEGGVFIGGTNTIGDSAGIYFKGGSEARQAATLNISGGTFNCAINGQSKSKLIITGGLFHYSVGSQGDSTALRLISGGKFKTLGFMTADSNNTKFWFGTSMANSNVGVYINDDNYLVVGGPVIKELSAEYPAVASNYSKWSSYLKYSSAAIYGLFYKDSDMAIAKHGAANVTVYDSNANKDEE